jgi:hypothetical protein
MGLKPFELEIEDLYGDYDRTKRKCTSEKALTPMVLVCNSSPIHNKADDSTSVDVLRIEPRNRRFANGKRSMRESSRRD